MEIVFIFLGVILAVVGDSYYNSLYQYNLTSAEVAKFQANGTLANCTIWVVDCNETEGRRINGTCNNLDYPAAGAAHTPPDRLLSPEFNLTAEDVFDPKLAVSGEALPPCRKVREAFLSDGSVPDTNLTSFITHLLVSFATDSATTRDTTNYVKWRKTCCTEAGKSEPMCFPLTVSDDDRVHRFSNIRCLNMTRPQTYATSGCCPNTTTPLRIVGATPLPDLSHVYGNVEDNRRSYKGGNLSVEYVNGRVYPDTTGIDLLLGINFFGIIYFWRWHNFIATQLASVNPSWDDDQLFSTTREINIGFYNQIMFYELWPLILGKDRLISDGVISDCSDFRDIYDDTTKPSIYNEYMIASRTLHTLQDGMIRMFDTDGNYLKKYPATNLTTDINYIKQGDNMDYLTQSCFRQPTAKSKDKICDSDMTNKGLGMLQVSTDILANDLCKSRLQGIQSYIKYRNLCFGDDITSFADLDGIIYPEDIETMKEIYGDIEDVDLMTGIWTEIPYDDAFICPTFYCIIKTQLYNFVASDRHWFERADRPNAFTADQLAEIRKVTAARMLCDIGDSVTAVQSSAFEVITDSNPLTSCDDITNIDYTVWYDDSCTTST